MCFEGMGAVGGLRAWGQLKRGFHVLALGEMCFEGMGAKGVKRGFEGMGAVEKGGG